MYYYFVSIVMLLMFNGNSSKVSQRTYTYTRKICLSRNRHVSWNKKYRSTAQKSKIVINEWRYKPESTVPLDYLHRELTGCDSF